MLRRPNAPLIPLIIAAIASICLMLTGLTVYAGAPDNLGTLQIIKRSEQSGNPLSGAVFGVYHSTEDKRLTDLTTNADGESSFMLEPGEYYLKELKPPYGYLLEQARIHFAVTESETVIVEVTNQRDASIPDNGADDDIRIPKTGKEFPILDYLIGTLLISVSIICTLCIFSKKNGC